MFWMSVIDNRSVSGVSEHLGENRAFLWLTIAKLWYFKLCAIFIEHRSFCTLEFAAFKRCAICSDV